MTFSSTESPDIHVSFHDAVFSGLAPDGGLYVPIEEPDLKRLFLGFPADGSFVEMAELMIGALFGSDIAGRSPAAIARTAFPFAPVMRPLTPQIDLLELFHGPSCAFKDFGASFLATILEVYLDGTDRRATILTATSGDTGSAVAQAFYGKKNIDVVVLYPSGRVSPLQEKQLTTVGGNVLALEVEGTFDDCQRMVKQAFQDRDLTDRFHLTSANSINLGRLLPQSFYYAFAWCVSHAGFAGDFLFSVPSGNFGNLTAGVYAWLWGLPVDRFIAATNKNDIIPEYLRTGVFKPRASVPTLSNAMDVGNPSNFERLRAVFRDDLMDIRTMIHGVSVSDDETVATMRRHYTRSNIVLDPHTATAVCAAEKMIESEYGATEHDGSVKIVVVSTAHPGKFGEVVYDALGIKPDIPERLLDALEKEKQSVVIGPDKSDLARVLSATRRTA